MNKQKVIDQLNGFRPPFLDLLKCEILDVDSGMGICKMKFDIGKELCHSGNIVQGGFVTAMLDTVSSHATFGMNDKIVAVSTMELKVSFYGPSNNGIFTAIGKVEKLTRNFAFLSADLLNDKGERTASLTSTAKVSYQKA